MYHGKIRENLQSIPTIGNKFTSNKMEVKENTTNFGKTKRFQGLLLMALAGLYLTLANCLVQLVYLKTRRGISSYMMLFCRSLVILLLNFVFMIVGRAHPYGEMKNIPILFLLGLAGVGQILFVFLSLERIPMGDATVIQFTAPVFTTAFSGLLLGTGCSLIDAVCGCVSFLGVVVMTKPSIFFGTVEKTDHEVNQSSVNNHVVNLSTDSEYIFGVIFALLAAIFVSIFYVLTKIFGQRLDVTVTVLYPSTFGIILAPIVGVAFKNVGQLPSDWITSLSLILVGFLSFVHLMFVAEALQLEDAGPASLIRNLDVVYAFFMQYMVLDIPPDWSTLLGACIVIASTTVIAIRRIAFSVDSKN